MKQTISTYIKRIALEFWKLHKGIVRSNVAFKNKHKGETCYIFGNGASLKLYDISCIGDAPIIGCAYTLIDNRMRSLNTRYIVSTDSYLFYPVLYNTYPDVQKFQKNRIRNIFKSIMEAYPGVHFFVNLTNFYSPICRRKNVSFIHHFGDRTSLSHDLAGCVSTMNGAVDIMFATAKYMGFSKAILLGCDYLGSPPLMGHFYADGKPFSGDYMPEYCKRVKAASEGLDVLLVVPKGVTSSDFPYVTFEEHFGLEPRNRKNNEIANESYLATLRIAAQHRQAVMQEE